jgi:iron complex transport system substrate-binding protein
MGNGATGPSRRTIAGAAMLWLAAPALAARVAPRRIVSLSPCTDAILIELVTPDRIAALSHFSHDPIGSTIAERAARLPITHETAEEVVLLRPDLVLASRHTDRATRAALARAGLTVELFDVCDTIEAALAEIARVAALVGEPGAGAKLRRRIEIALACASAPLGWRPRPALIFQPNGFVAGGGTLPDALLQRAGFTNAAAHYGVRKWGTVRLEDLLQAPPAILFLGEHGRAPWADRVLTHPALAKLAGHTPRVTFPERLLYCAGPAMVRAVATFARGREVLA